MKLFIYYTSPVLIFILITGCKKLVAIDRADFFITPNEAFATDNTAAAVLNGIYVNMTTAENGIVGVNSISTYTGLSVDELRTMPGIAIYEAYYTNSLSTGIPSGTTSGIELWPALYKHIYNINEAIEGLSSKGQSLTPAVRKQLMGEAQFLRAFVYFYLVNLYGPIPLALSTDYKVNSLLSRSSMDHVYEQIITDLIAAQSQLNETYYNGTISSSSSLRVRPSKWAASALLARVYLYTREYAKAAAAATELIDNTALFELPALNNVFLYNSREAIWQLQPTTLNFNTEDGKLFILSGGLNGTTPFYLSPMLLDSIEVNDQRKVSGNWINEITVGSDVLYYPYKYKKNELDGNITKPSDISEYTIVLRLAEQYLIRAEARAQEGKIIDAQADVNAIRHRAGLGDVAANTKESLLLAIEKERQLELFTEFGHRWLDLKRTGRINETMPLLTSLKGGSWESTDQWYPLPDTEIQKGINLTQNEGY